MNVLLLPDEETGSFYFLFVISGMGIFSLFKDGHCGLKGKTRGYRNKNGLNCRATSFLICCLHIRLVIAFKLDVLERI